MRGHAKEPTRSLQDELGFLGLHSRSSAVEPHSTAMDSSINTLATNKSYARAGSFRIGRASATMPDQATSRWRINDPFEGARSLQLTGMVAAFMAISALIRELP